MVYTKPTYKDLPGGGFEFGGVQFDKGGTPTAVTSRGGVSLINDAINSQNQQIARATAQDLLNNQKIQENLTPKQSRASNYQIGDLLPDPNNVGGLLRLKSQADLNNYRKGGFLGNSNPVNLVNFEIPQQIISGADIVSGGAISRNKINKQQENLYSQIDSFNAQYGNKQLSDEDYKRAKLQENYLNKQADLIQQANINLAKSRRGEIGRFFDADVGLRNEAILRSPAGIESLKNDIKAKIGDLRIDKTGTFQRKVNYILNNIDNLIGRPYTGKTERLLKKNINDLEIARIQTQEKFNDLNIKKTNPISRYLDYISSQIGLRKGSNSENTKNKRYEDILAGIPTIKIIKGPDFPIVPAFSIPGGVQAVKFIGTQRVGQDGKIITDLVFLTNNYRVGVAKGVTVFRDEEGLSVVLGKSGKKFINFPTGKESIRDLISFVGKDTSRAKDATALLRTTLKDLSYSQKMDGLLQASKGELAIFKGTKAFYPRLNSLGGLSLKQAKIINDESRSVSFLLNNGDFARIVGKAKSIKGGDAGFIGLIKRASSGVDIESSSGGVSVITKGVSQLKLDKALKQVAGITAGALSQAGKAGAVNQASRVVLASLIVKNQAKGTPLAPQVKQQLAKKINSVLTTLPKTQVNTKTLTALTSVLSQSLETKNKTKSINKTAQISKTAQATGQAPAQSNASRSAQQQQLKQLMKNPLKTKEVIRAITTGIPTPRLKLIPLVDFWKSKKAQVNKGSKEIGYNVYVKAGGRFVKINSLPLRKGDALSRGAYAVDNTTARSFKIIPAGKTSKLGALNIYERGYYEKKYKKFRNYQIRKGKKKGLNQTLIERKKYLIDTRGEKRGLRITRDRQGRFKKVFKAKTIKRAMKSRPKRKPYNIWGAPW